MTDTTKVLWRVQVRKSRDSKWQNKGLYETRDSARRSAGAMRWAHVSTDADGRMCVQHGYGFGNTRVVRHERAAK